LRAGLQPELQLWVRRERGLQPDAMRPELQQWVRYVLGRLDL
jgi:hypothetical protein